ncbi:metallophosphoesterase [Pararhodobacter sp.]|uniref:metallophosphoesterase n=1 Tax=Pararhodobacter sp. TaxID=2127056 RepID=UPI002FDD8A9B
MKFLFWSDLHCEVAPFEIPVPACQPGATPGAPARRDIDAILLGGDTHTKGQHLAVALMAWDLWRCPVLWVWGNHESYGSRFQKLFRQEAERVEEVRMLGADLRPLHGDVTRIGDARIIGATLWTDFALWQGQELQARMTAQDTMNDYRKVQWHDEKRGIYRRMIPGDTATMHRRERQFILETLAQPHDGPTVVMTHHLPVPELLEARYRDRRDLITAAYASDLRADLQDMDFDIWLSGHSHSATEVTLDIGSGPRYFACNQRGYPGSETAFDPLRVFTVGAPDPEPGMRP